MKAGSKTNPWLSMWTEPRKTIRGIITTDPSKQMLALCIVYGFPIMIHMARFFSAGTNFSMWTILLLSLLLSPIAGFIGISFTSALVYWTGKWINGKSKYKELRSAVAWSNVPTVVTCITWVILALSLGQGLFMAGFYAEEMPLATLATFLFGLQVIASIWSFVIFLIALSEVQKFSILRAIANVVIPFIIVSVLGHFLNMFVM